MDGHRIHKNWELLDRPWHALIGDFLVKPRVLAELGLSRATLE
jgi:hypothetical protein